LTVASGLDVTPAWRCLDTLSIQLADKRRLDPLTG
jgi:hypothetical protein